MNILNIPFHNIHRTYQTCSLAKQNFNPAFKRKASNDTFEKASDRVVQTKYGTVHYHNDKFSYLEFNKPKNLKDTLKAIQYIQNKYNLLTYGISRYEHTYKDFEKAFSDKFKDMSFVRYLGAGNTAMAIENTDGKVLKLSAINQFSFDRKPEKFDARVYEKGITDDGYFYYLQEKCDITKVNNNDIDKISKMIEDAGYTPFDMSEDQIGIAKDGKAYLIDPECAKDDKALEEIRNRCLKWALEHGLDYDFI